jgi:xylulose-5-phosphate/fructose-6-phosphate phosphoketolase
MNGVGSSEINLVKLDHRIDFCNYLSVAQIFLQDNFLLNRPLAFSDVKPRLLGHWGTCPGINIAYANLKARFPEMQFILGPGHGFPALQANLFVDGELEKYYPGATRNLRGIEFVCRNFSWPYGFPSHASPATPGVIAEGGELGYSLATAYGAALGNPDKLIAVLIGDGELETATALSSLNLDRLLNSDENGHVLSILHLNGYKISAPTVYGRASERELMQMFRGFGFEPVMIDGTNNEEFQQVLSNLKRNTFIIMKTPKGYTGPKQLDGVKLEGNCASHQVPLPQAKTDENQLKMLEKWLESYNIKELYGEFASENR